MATTPPPAGPPTPPLPGPPNTLRLRMAATIPTDQEKAIARWNKWRLWTTIAIVVAILILFAVITIFTNAWIAAAVSGYAFWEFIRRGWEDISDNPPTKWMPTILGKPLNILMKWGLFFFPLKNSWLLYYITVPGTEEELRFTVTMRTPDGAEMQIPFFLYFVVDDKNPVQFLLAGNLDRVKKKLQDLIEETLREWITSPDKGPRTWEEARQAILETLNVVLEVLFERDLQRLDPNLPTEILIRFFGHRLTQKEQEEWAEYLSELQQNRTRQVELEVKVEDRKRLIQDAKTGKIKWGITSLGVVVTRIGLSNIEPAGKTADAVNGIITARLDATAQDITAANFRQNVELLTPIMGGDHKEARKAESVRREITKEEIKEIHLSSDAGTLQGLGDILGRLFRR